MLSKKDKKDIRLIIREEIELAKARTIIDAGAIRHGDHSILGGRMALSPTDIEAIASAVVRRMKAVEEIRLDEAYLCTLPVEERNRLAREEMRRERESNKKLIEETGK